MDHVTLVSELLDVARAKDLRVAVAESCTGGMVGSAITDVAGSSDVFERGFVTYSNLAKVEMLGVSQASLDEYGAVSEEVAQEMAIGAIGQSDADLAVSITGVAGPGGTADKPEGMVCFGIATIGGAQTSETQLFGPLGRAGVRSASVEHALKLLLATASTDC